MEKNTSGQFIISSLERRAAASLGGIFALRMLGLFMILPVFSLYAHHLKGVTPMLTGLAIGAYGLTQAFLQIPFGLLSDRIGRKRVIIIGLLIFSAGSVVAATSDSIYGVIAGRALQGAGAIAAAIMALLADLTRVEIRTKAMAILGGSIGMSFTLALLLGPVLNGLIGVPGIFWLTSVLALGGILIILYLVPDPVDSHFHTDTEPVLSQFGKILSDTQLLRLDFGIFCLHFLITATFLALPLLLRDTIRIPAGHHWWIYMPTLLLAVATMFPFIRLGERHGHAKAVFLGAIATIILAEAGLSMFHAHIYQIAILLYLFFTGFNLMEATLPSLISKLAPVNSKGTAMGAYSSSQFLGAFVGGGAGGWVMGQYGVSSVFAGCAIMALIWLSFAISMKAPQAHAPQESPS